jgi:transposase
MLYLGIDQHRKQLTVNLRDEQGNVLLRRQVSTTWSKVRAFFAELRQQAEPQGGFAAIVEVCGFNDWLLKMLSEYGCRHIVLAQADRRGKKKTDRRDAHALAELLWINRARLAAGEPLANIRRVHPASPADAADRQLTVLRKRLAQLRTRTLNRIQHLLLKHNIQQQCPTKGLQTKAAREWLTTLTLDDIDRLELDCLLEQWKLWNEQLEKLDAQVRDRQAKNETAAYLASVPGLSCFSSLAIACRIGDIRRFPRPGSLANYWGLTPGCRNSGEANQRLGSITKEGSAIVRFLLGQAVIHILRRDPDVRAGYQQIKKRRGSKIARVAVMRRTATTIWRMLTHKEPYHPGKSSGQKRAAVHN